MALTTYEEAVYRKALDSPNLDAVAKVADCFEKRGHVFWAMRLRRRIPPGKVGFGMIGGAWTVAELQDLVKNADGIKANVDKVRDSVVNGPPAPYDMTQAESEYAAFADAFTKARADAQSAIDGAKWNVLLPNNAIPADAQYKALQLALNPDDPHMPGDLSKSAPNSWMHVMWLWTNLGGKLTDPVPAAAPTPSAYVPFGTQVQAAAPYAQATLDVMQQVPATLGAGLGTVTKDVGGGIGAGLGALGLKNILLIGALIAAGLYVFMHVSPQMALVRKALGR